MNEEAHIDENIKIANDSYPELLNESELQLVDSVRKKYLELMKIGCTGCNYCMPCSSGVNIPYCFEFYNSAHMFGSHKRAKMMYLFFLSGAVADPAFASMCEKCGECEEACPQNLPIQTTLDIVAREFEGKWFNQTAWLVRKVFAFQRWKDLRRAKN
jgi:predicted aldo/keto reductase-like oxidoreductase